MIEKAVRRVINQRYGKRQRTKQQQQQQQNPDDDLPLYTLDNIIDVLRSPLAKQTIKGTNVYEIDGVADGLHVITQALTVGDQLTWAKTCLEKYSTATHTNVLNLKRLEQENISGFPKNITDDQREMLAEIYCKSTLSFASDSEVDDADVNNESSNADRFLWQSSVQENNKLLSFHKMRWASLGYHYDWTSRRYYKDAKSEFPVELLELSQKLASLVGNTLKPEAAIVNFYPLGSTMGGHLDDAEFAMERPIISISLGCPAVFLIGGRTRDIAPTALILRSGDVLVMSRESRHSFHGIPSILPLDSFDSALHSYLLLKEGLGSTDPVEEYLRGGRININVRQVSIDGTWPSQSESRNG